MFICLLSFLLTALTSIYALSPSYPNSCAACLAGINPAIDIGSSIITVGDTASNAASLLAACQTAKACLTEPEPWEQQHQSNSNRNRAASADLDFRVTKGHGPSGYNHVRLVVVSNATTQWYIPNRTRHRTTPTSTLTPTPVVFTYDEPFQYRWTDNKLSSVLLDVTPGLDQDNMFRLPLPTSTRNRNGNGNGNRSFAGYQAKGDQGSDLDIDPAPIDINIRIPAAGEGARGIIIADPCFSWKNIPCFYSHKFDTLNRLTTLLNAAFIPGTDLSFYGVLGDNFYDKDGTLGKEFFSRLSIHTKSKLFLSVAGNHDLWILGTPLLAQTSDQYGNGHMQYVRNIYYV